MDDVPPGMGPIEYRALCRAQADPAYLKAVRDRTFEKFSKFPGAVNGPPKREWHPPPPSSDSGGSVTGLPSPSTSEHGEPARPLKKAADGTSKEGTSVSNDRSTERANRSPVTPKQSKKTYSRKDSRISKTERRERKIRTRTTLSKASSATSSSELDETDKLGEDSGSTAAAAPSSGQDSSQLEHFLRTSKPQTSTKKTPSRPAAKIKRKRDEDDDSTRKRARVEPSTGTSAVLAAVKDTNKKPDTEDTVPSRIENWLKPQEHIYKPTHSKTIDDDAEASASTNQQMTKAQEPLLSDPKSGQIQESVAPKQLMGRKINESALRMLMTRDRNSRNDGTPPSSNSGHGSRVPVRSTIKPPAAAKPCGVEKKIKKLKRVHHRKIEDLLSASKATIDYCKALELEEEVALRANLYLTDVFHHPFPEYHPTHALVVGCVIFSYGGGGVKLRSETGLRADKIFSPDVPPDKCGPAIAAVRQFFLSQDSKRMKPKATRRGPETYPKSKRPRS